MLISLIDACYFFFLLFPRKTFFIIDSLKSVKREKDMFVIYGIILDYCNINGMKKLFNKFAFFMIFHPHFLI